MEAVNILSAESRESRVDVARAVGRRRLPCSGQRQDRRVARQRGRWAALPTRRGGAVVGWRGRLGEANW